MEYTNHLDRLSTPAQKEKFDMYIHIYIERKEKQSKRQMTTTSLS